MGGGGGYWVTGLVTVGNLFENLARYMCLIVLSGQVLLVTPSLTCSFASNYHFNFPRPAPIWPSSSVGRATVICSVDCKFEPHRGQKYFVFPRVGPFLF